MFKVFKYPLPKDRELGQPFTMELPYGFVPLKVDIDARGFACIWAKIDDENIKVIYNFVEVGTGMDLENGERCISIGSYFDAQFIWHLFQIRE